MFSYSPEKKQVLTKRKEDYLAQTSATNKLAYCYHLTYLGKMRPLTFDIQHPFRVICSSCFMTLNPELSAHERIFPLERIRNPAVKYHLFSKGCIKVAQMMKTKKAKQIWDFPFVEGFLEVFEHSENAEEMHEDLLWVLKHMNFDEDVFKFSANSPYFQQQFQPKRNINMIDVRYVLERLLSIHIVYHMIANPEYKLQGGEMPLDMPQGEYASSDEEEIVKKEEVKEEIIIPDPPFLAYKAMDRLDVELSAPYNILRKNHEFNGLDLTEKEFEQELKALKIIYPDFICFGLTPRGKKISKHLIQKVNFGDIDIDIYSVHKGLKTTHAIAETNMDYIDKRMPVLKEFVLKCPLQGGMHPSYSYTKHLYFLYEIKPVRLFICAYPMPDKSLKEWVIHTTEMFTSGVMIRDKPTVDKIVEFREKFLIGLNKILREIIPKTIVLPTRPSIFIKTSSHYKEHFVTLGEKIFPSEFPRRVCLSMLKRSLQDWHNFDTARNFNVTMDDIIYATDRYPHK